MEDAAVIDAVQEAAVAVERGAALLDKKVPGWKRTMAKHAEDFDLADGSCCVLGTLEHYNGRMKVLNKQGDSEPSYSRGTIRLGITGAEYGFYADSYSTKFQLLTALWKAKWEAQ